MDAAEKCPDILLKISSRFDRTRDMCGFAELLEHHLWNVLHAGSHFDQVAWIRMFLLTRPPPLFCWGFSFTPALPQTKWKQISADYLNTMAGMWAAYAQSFISALCRRRRRRRRKQMSVQKPFPPRGYDISLTEGCVFTCSLNGREIHLIIFPWCSKMWVLTQNVIL